MKSLHAKKSGLLSCMLSMEFFFLPHTGLGPGYALDFATPRNAAQTCFMFPWMCHN